MKDEMRLCVVCGSVIPHTYRAMYCEPHRLEVRRRTWRESKRRTSQPLKGIVREIA